MARKKLTTLIEEELIKKLKIEAIENDSSPNEILEEMLYKRYDINKKDKPRN